MAIGGPFGFVCIYVMADSADSVNMYVSHDKMSPTKLCKSHVTKKYPLYCVVGYKHFFSVSSNMSPVLNNEGLPSLVQTAGFTDDRRCRVKFVLDLLQGT